MKTYLKMSVLCLALFSCAAPPPAAESPLDRRVDGKTFATQKKILSKACLKEARWAPHPRRANYNARYEDLCLQMKKSMRSADAPDEKRTIDNDVKAHQLLRARCDALIKEYVNPEDGDSVGHGRNMTDICHLMTGTN